MNSLGLHLPGTITAAAACVVTTPLARRAVPRHSTDQLPASCADFEAVAGVFQSMLSNAADWSNVVVD